MDNGERKSPSQEGLYRKYEKKPTDPRANNILLICCLAAILVGLIFFIMSLTGSGLYKDPSYIPPAKGEDTEDSSGSDSTDGDDSDSQTEEEDPTLIKYDYLDKTMDDTGEGILVLLDKDHSMKKFPTNELGLISDYKSDSYKLNLLTLKLLPQTVSALNKMMDAYVKDTGFQNAIVSEAYRDFDRQKYLYDRAADKTQTAMPGCSDYHTGTTFYLESYFFDIKAFYELPNVPEAKASWFADNMAKYGFISRFPSDKKAVTGYDLPWQLRYVGTPHAVYMKENNLCFEEYLELLAKEHKYGGEHLSIDCLSADGKLYEVFYVEADAEGTVKVPVPSNREYTVSGDNKGGFIVTMVTEVQS